MAKRCYKVTLHYCTSVTLAVWGENEEDALADAYLRAGNEGYDEALLNNMTEDGDADIEEIEDNPFWELDENGIWR